MRYRDMKRLFIENVIRGIPQLTEVSTRVPEPLQRRWLAKFYEPIRPKEVPESPRLLNHFKVGADPEFVFRTPDRTVMNAETLGLMSGLCFGADNNGRLVELRPAPSRFAVEVVASMLVELRWLAFYQPKSLNFQWKAGAFTGHEGLGGHVHFGRKVVSQRGFEVRALDKVTELMFQSEIFDANEQRARITGPGGYGGYSDIRKQVHGYEYRTVPSWLDSPWKAHLSITLAKLAVCDPSMILAQKSFISPAENRKRIRNILAAYKGRDDDAMIAGLAFTVHGWPTGRIDDFRPEWGIEQPVIEGVLRSGFVPPKIMPTTVSPTRSEIGEIFSYLTSGTNLTLHPPKAEWPFQSIPSGFKYLLSMTKTTRCPGIGELLHDALTPIDGFVVAYCGSNSESDRTIRMSPSVCDMLGKEGFRSLRNLLPTGTRLHRQSEWGGAHHLEVSKTLLAPNTFPVTKAALFSGLLPICRYKDHTTFDTKAWVDRLNSATAPKKSRIIEDYSL